MVLDFTRWSSSRPPLTCLGTINQRNSENVCATGFQDPAYFSEGRMGVENVFHDVLGNEQVELFVVESQTFEVFAAPPALRIDRAKGDLLQQE